jgi:hypothetical protein
MEDDGVHRDLPIKGRERVGTGSFIVTDHDFDTPQQLRRVA